MEHICGRLRSSFLSLLIVAGTFCAAATSLTLNVKIDPPVHDCRFQPIIAGVPEGVGISDVRMDLYENASKEFSYSLLHREFAEPLAPADFAEAFSDFQLMPDGFYADGLGYYHTTWHYYLLTVTLSDGSQAQVKSRPFRVPENPFHMFCAQIVNEPFMGSFTYKPGSSIIYQVYDSDHDTGKFFNYKKVADISKMPDMYANWETTWTDSAFVFAQLPDAAKDASAVLWTLTSDGGTVIPPITSTDLDNFAYCVMVDHFGEETFHIALDYTIKGSNGADSTVTVTNFQKMKMRLSTPCFAYDNAVYSAVSADSEPTDILLEPSDFSGMAAGSGIYAAEGSETVAGARMLHLDMYSFLQVSPNMFSNTDIVLEITITDTKYPWNAAKRESHTYGPFLYTYSNKNTALGVVKLTNCRPSDWFTVNPVTGAVSPVNHQITITYTSGTHEFYFSQAKNTSVWKAAPSFGHPQVSRNSTPHSRFRRFDQGGWHECLWMYGLEDYQPQPLYVNNRTAIPEQEPGGNLTEYYTLASRWGTDGSQAFEYGFNHNRQEETPHLIPGNDLLDATNGSWFFLGKVQCGDGEYVDDMFTRNWFNESNFEVAAGRVYFFAYDAEPQMSVTIDDVPLELAPSAARRPRRAGGTARAEAFLPAVSSETFTAEAPTTGLEEISVSSYVRGGIGAVIVEGAPAKVFNLAGIPVAEGMGRLPLAPGVYIARAAGVSTKVLVQ